MKKFGPYNGILEISGTRNNPDESIFAQLFGRAAERQVIDINLKCDHGKLVGIASLPAERFARSVSPGDSFEVEFTTVGPKGPFDFFSPSIPEHRVTCRESDSALPEDEFSVCALNIVSF